MKPVLLQHTAYVHETATWKAASAAFHECGLCGAPISTKSVLARRYMVLSPDRLIVRGRPVRAASLTLDSEIEGLSCEFCTAEREAGR